MSDNHLYSAEKIPDLIHLKKFRKRKFIKFFSILSPVIFTVYGILHIVIEKDIFMALLCFFVSFTFLLNFLFYLKYKASGIKKLLSVSLLLSIILLVFEIVKGSFSNAGILWTAPFPIFAYYLKGRKQGSVYILIFLMLCSSLIALNFIFNFYNTYDINGYIHALIIFLFIALMINFYEEANEKNEDMIIRQLYTDSLTGLPNRSKLLNDIADLYKDQDSAYNLILININGFKTVNGIYGSKIGDHIIREISGRLKLYSAIYGIYKLNFDEFGLVLKNNLEKNLIEEHIKNINQLLKREYNISGHEIILSFSYGISLKSSEMLLNADTALKYAKSNKTVYAFYQDIKNDDEKKTDKIGIVNLLKQAIISDNILPYYQPIFNNINDRIEEYECLIRLDTGNEILTPNKFLSVAKSAKMYPHMTKIMFLKSFETFKDKDYSFSINLTNEDLFNAESTDFIFNLIDDYRINDRLVIELVESEELDQNDHVIKILKKFKDYGCRLAIDDFGSGYSNFNYLLRLNIDYLKLDSSLIKNIDTDLNSQIVTKTIVDFCKKLGIKTVAEHIHNKEVHETAKMIGIDYSQGFFLGKPDSFIDI